MQAELLLILLSDVRWQKHLRDSSDFGLRSDSVYFSAASVFFVGRQVLLNGKLSVFYVQSIHQILIVIVNGLQQLFSPIFLQL